jgi:hypothetical protein
VSASRLAKILDQEMIEGAGIDIASARTPPEDLPVRAGTEVSAELGGRLLIRYMLGPQLGKFAGGSTDRHFVTPTPSRATRRGLFWPFHGSRNLGSTRC